MIRCLSCSLFYWAREYSSALPEGGAYSKLPRTIVVSILAFSLFKCEEFHSEFELLEAKRFERLTDRLAMHYFELPKLSSEIDSGDELNLWLALFNAKSEEELINLEKIGGDIMAQAVKAYRHVSASNEFKELERLRSRARHNEASALANAMLQGIQQGVQQTAIKMLKKGMSVAETAEVTGLYIDDVLRLQY
jgi:predicted transposase/invertase (TIGR01784 family)